jgi:hypothetical protein
MRRELAEKLNTTLMNGPVTWLSPSHIIRDKIPPILCASGLKFSMQASEHHRCSPRNNQGPWDTVEIGFPSRRVEDLMPYVEDEDNPTQTVYTFVPIEIVAKIILDNGGLRRRSK